MIDFGYGVALGPLDRKFNELYRSWRNQYSIWKWCRQSDIISDADQERWFESQSQDKSIRMYTVQTIVKEAWLPIGVAGFTSIDRINGRAEFSLYIEPNHQQAGLGTRALKTLVRHGFDNMAFNSIWGESFEGNPAMKVFERLGFKKDGVRRQFYYRSGKFIDAHLYSILRKEWACS